MRRAFVVLVLSMCWALHVVAFAGSENLGRRQLFKTSIASAPARSLQMLRLATITPDKVTATEKTLSRRRTLSCAFHGLLTLASALSLSKQAQAACLMGDTSPDCIGVYKVPMDDEMLPYMSTPDLLRRYAPDVRWVPPVKYPKTYKAAITEVNSLQQRLQDLPDLVLEGNFTNAGTELLDIIPRLTASGRVIVQMLKEANRTDGEVDLSMKAYRAEVANSDLVNKLSQTDILIGQAISGQLGATAPAQLQILSELKEANGLFDELLKSIPDDFKGNDKRRR